MVVLLADVAASAAEAEAEAEALSSDAFVAADDVAEEMGMSRR